MKKKLVFLIFLSVILSADEKNLIDSNSKENLSVYVDEQQRNNNNLKEINIASKYLKDDNTDISKYKKVSLMDVVLETIGTICVAAGGCTLALTISTMFLA